MTPRQKKADAISRALRRDFGEDAVVINPLPLRPEEQLRIQILDSKRDAVVGKLCEWGWLPNYLQFHPRVGHGRVIPASIHEIRLEHEKQPVPDRRISGEIAERGKTSAEVESVMRYLGRGR